MVIETEELPRLNHCVEKLPTDVCGYCGKLEEYIVANEYSHTKCGHRVLICG